MTEDEKQLKEREVRALEKIAKNMPAKKKPWVCGSWPYCYHGRIMGGVFGCYGMN